MHHSFKMSYQEPILVHPVRRQNFGDTVAQKCNPYLIRCHNIEVIRVKRRVPAEKEKKQVVEEVKESEKVFPLNPKPKEASKATYAGDYGL